VTAHPSECSRLAPARGSVETTTATVAVILAMLASSARAQAPTAPCEKVLPVCWHFDTTEATRRETGTALFVGGTYFVVASNLVWGWDHDPGGYPDKFYPTKAFAHAGAAAILTETAIACHVRPWFAVLWTNVAGVGFELSQGRVNRHDLAANAAGSLLGYAMARWLAPLRFR
jgi:hypothetical protein